MFNMTLCVVVQAVVWMGYNLLSKGFWTRRKITGLDVFM